jgi:hypothetical protein
MFRRSTPAYALATVLILMSVILFAAGSMITVSTLESKISRSEQEGTRAYYVAEAGVQDALWRLNNTNAYSDALVTGTLNATYTATDEPASGEGYVVTLTTDPALGAGYAVVDVTGTYNDGYITASRKIRTKVFQGTVTSPVGANAVFAGGNLSITNGSGALTIHNGDVYGVSSFSANNTNVNMSGGNINTLGNAIINGGNVLYNQLYAANYPPAPTAISAPGIDFSYYATHYNTYYTANQFQNLFSGNAVTVNLPGPVTYVDGSVNLQVAAKNDTLNVTGMLVINGSFSVTSAASGFKMNIIDPGNGKSGLFARTSCSIGIGTFNVNGIMFSAGNLSVTNTNVMTVNGGIFSGSNIALNTGVSMDIIYNATRVARAFGAGGALNVQVEHWEEEY